MSLGKTLWLTLFIIVCTIHPPITLLADWKEAVKQGDKLYGKRAEKNGKKDLYAAIKKYEEATSEISKNDEKTLSKVYVKLSQAYFTLAEYFAKDDDELSDLTDEGQDWAKEAVEADPKNAEAYYWLGANMALWRTVHKLSFRGGLTGGGIKKLLKKAAELDPNCAYGLPYMLLADLELSKGNLKDAQSNAAKGALVEPKMLKNQLILAEVVWKNNKAEAKTILKHISNQSYNILPSETLENRSAIEKAKKILEELKKGNEPDW
ncbi:MAG: tetratricopeptide repeat protein [Planctomycetota bacterium]|jgi:hypothetical protein